MEQVVIIVLIMSTNPKVSVGTPSISAMELRSNPGSFLDRVDYLNESFIVERAGKPKAVLVPLSLYRVVEESKSELVSANKQIRKAFSKEPRSRVQKEIEKSIRETRNAS